MIYIGQLWVSSSKYVLLNYKNPSPYAALLSKKKRKINDFNEVKSLFPY
jgi:hypothetical protein